MEHKRLALKIKLKIKRIINRLWCKIKINSQGWRDDHLTKGVKKRNYKAYGAYLAHQKSKLKTIDLSDYDARYYKALKQRLENTKELNIPPREKNVLCLAARLGTEVRVFLDLGQFAVGIDLNPGKENKYVIYGDFHNIQFPSNSVDIVFTNSIDHAYDLTRVINEVKRVLKPLGILILEVAKGEKEGGDVAGFHESMAWDYAGDVIRLFTDADFKLIKKEDFQEPWVGQCVLMKKN